MSALGVLRDVAAETVAKASMECWIAVSNIPSSITTNHGMQFESALFTNLANVLGTNRVRTTACHPPANDLMSSAIESGP